MGSASSITSIVSAECCRQHVRATGGDGPDALGEGLALNVDSKVVSPLHKAVYAFNQFNLKVF